MDDEPAESLWVRIKYQAGMGGIVSVRCTTPDQEREVDEAYKQHEQKYLTGYMRSLRGSLYCAGPVCS